MRLLLVLFIINGINGWNINDICYNDNVVSSVQLNCTGIHKFNCGFPFCACDLKSCETFIKLTFLLRLDEIYKKRNAYEILISNVDLCNKAAYVWKPANVCVKVKFCKLEYPKNNRLILSHLAYKESACRCRGNFSYDCGKSFCTTNAKTCGKLPKRYRKEKRKNMPDLKQC